MEMEERGGCEHQANGSVTHKTTGKKNFRKDGSAE
jgi:hypothetical protein